MRKLFFFCISVFFLLSNMPAKQKFVKIYLPNGISITAELALTDEERQRGLMFRERISPDQGMLFVFGEEGIYSFWMKNMRFPIDILWLDRERRIVHVEAHVLPCREEPCPSYVPRHRAKYVLELKSGSVEENELKLYDRLEFVLPDFNINSLGCRLIAEFIL